MKLNTFGLRTSTFKSALNYNYEKRILFNIYAIQFIEKSEDRNG